MAHNSLRLVARKFVRIGALLVVTGIAVGGYATAARAARSSGDAGAAPLFHLALTRSVPAKDSTVAAPTTLSLWFSENPPLNVTKITLVASAGDTVKLGALTRAAAAGSPIVAPVTGTLAAGKYRVDWASVADDGDASKGTFQFSVRAAGQ